MLDFLDAQQRRRTRFLAGVDVLNPRTKPGEQRMNKRAGPLVVGETLEKSSAKLSGIDSENRKTLMNSVTKLRLKQAAAAVLSVCVVGTMLTLTAPGVAADATISQTFSYTVLQRPSPSQAVLPLGVILKG
ncbi:MAG: hypothetical protein R2735_05295 [Microthrixaceae bacterium]